jgi:hypothetical protein
MQKETIAKTARNRTSSLDFSPERNYGINMVFADNEVYHWIGRCYVLEIQQQHVRKKKSLNNLEGCQYNQV